MEIELSLEFVLVSEEAAVLVTRHGRSMDTVHLSRCPDVKVRF